MSQQSKPTHEFIWEHLRSCRVGAYLLVTAATVLLLSWVTCIAIYVLNLNSSFWEFVAGIAYLGGPFPVIPVSMIALAGIAYAFGWLTQRLLGRRVNPPAPNQDGSPDSN